MNGKASKTVLVLPMYRAIIYALFPVVLLVMSSCNPRLASGLRKSDLKKDVAIVTSKGTIVVRLSDSTPLHRDNFLKLAKQGYYDSVLFHRVIARFMIQAGDPSSRRAQPGESLGNGGPGYTIPAEFRPSLFHKKGVIAAARTGDDVNPQRASSGSQFYIVQGKVFSDEQLDSVETFRLKGRKLPPEHRAVYKTVGGAPHLDQNYTIFGEVIEGLPVLDSIAVVPTSGPSGGNRPLQDVRILRTKMVKRSR